MITNPNEMITQHSPNQTYGKQYCYTLNSYCFGFFIYCKSRRAVNSRRVGSLDNGWELAIMNPKIYTVLGDNAGLAKHGPGLSNSDYETI